MINKTFLENGNNHFNFNSGYRVGLEYSFCGTDGGVGVFYTHLNTGHKRHICGNYLTPAVGIEDYTYYMVAYKGEAISSLNTGYKRLDALYFNQFYRCNGFDLHLILGLECADFNVDQHLRYTPEQVIGNTYSSKVSQKSVSRGIGPEIGFDVDYELCHFQRMVPGSLNLSLYSTASLLVSDSKSETNISYTSSTPTVFPYHVCHERSTRMIPAFHLGISLKYDFCLCGYGSVVSVGYEFNTYLQSILSVKNNAYYGKGLTNTQYNDYNLQGLVVSLNIKF